MDHRNGDELEAPLLESAPLPEKRRSTFLTVCPFILGRGQVLWQLSLLMHITAVASTFGVHDSDGNFPAIHLHHKACHCRAHGAYSLSAVRVPLCLRIHMLSWPCRQ